MHMHTEPENLTHLRTDLNALERFLGHAQCDVYALRANLKRWLSCQARGIE